MDSYNVLFLCTGNSARSILAEAILNSLPQAKGRFHAFSAGSQPRSVVNPLALDVLREHKIASEGLRSKSWEEFALPGAPTMDFVFTTDIARAFLSGSTMLTAAPAATAQKPALASASTIRVASSTP